MNVSVTGVSLREFGSSLLWHGEEGTGLETQFPLAQFKPC